MLGSMMIVRVYQRHDTAPATTTRHCTAMMPAISQKVARTGSNGGRSMGELRGLEVFGLVAVGLLARLLQDRQADQRAGVQAEHRQRDQCGAEALPARRIGRQQARQRAAVEHEVGGAIVDARPSAGIVVAMDQWLSHETIIMSSNSARNSSAITCSKSDSVRQKVA